MDFQLHMPAAFDSRTRRSVEAARANGPPQANARHTSSNSVTATPIMEVDRQLGSAAGTPSPVAEQRTLVFPDPIAFRFLIDDPCVTVVHRKQRLQGYELYLVEQWACSRIQPTTVIVTYTGDTTQSVVVGVLSVPRDEAAWSDSLRVYMKAVQQYHARPKDTPLGELMVTNLSSFPSALTVIAVPEGNIKRYRDAFVVNENLKRLGCSGRSGMTLSEPTAAAKAKFYQLYKANDKIPFDQAVIELVKLCQVALYIFDTLHAAYVDGLLCDITEKALTDWWTQFGADYYNMEPADGILGPTTVAALLGLCVGARNRLSYLNAPVSKDVFDIDSTERGIAYFQKYQKITRSRRLDRQTMHKLHNATAKAAAGEGWGVQKAVKSTVTEIGGKRGEIVLGMVGGRDKGAIGDIETLDLDRFISLASGERAKWLWLGKPKRPGADNTNNNNDDRGSPEREVGVITKEGNATTSRKTQVTPLDDMADPFRKEEQAEVYAIPAPGSAISVGESPSSKDQLRRGVLKSVARDARSGLGRIKDAVSGTGRIHGPRQSRDDSDGFLSPTAQSSAANLASPGTGLTPINRAFTWKNKPEEYLTSMRDTQNDSRTALSANPQIGNGSPVPKSGQAGSTTVALDKGRRKPVVHQQPQSQPKGSSETQLEAVAPDSSIANSTADESELLRRGSAEKPRGSLDLGILTTLRRRRSFVLLSELYDCVPLEDRWARRMSFGDAEQAVLRWRAVVSPVNITNTSRDAPSSELVGLSEVATSLYDQIRYTKTSIEPWVIDKISAVQNMDRTLSQQAEDLETLYLQQSDFFRQAKHDSDDLLSRERSQLTEASSDLKNLLNRLEYELTILSSRVQDVEDGVVNFEAQVEDMERRADQLKTELETETWLHWAVRTLTGIGTGPNITQGVKKQVKE